MDVALDRTSLSAREAADQLMDRLGEVNDRALELMAALNHPELRDQWQDRVSKLAWANNYLTHAALALLCAGLNEAK